MIELKNVSKYYNSSGVVSVGLRNIDLKLNKNEIVAIVGDSGSGKSTLLNVICCVDTYEDGEMYFYGSETSHFNQNDMDLYRKEHVGFIYQNYNIIDSYTVLENVMLPLILAGKSKEEAKKRALELLTEVGLSHRVHNKGAKLSGGEKQRCVIARALASDCSILACDEPTGNLDSKTSKEIIELIKKVAKDKLVLIVTHNYEEVMDIVTRKIKVSDGIIVEDYVIDTVYQEDSTLAVKENIAIKKRDLAKIALNNIKCTPRKTIFSFLVFFFISLVAFYLYLTCMAASETSVFRPDRSFSNYQYNRLIIFNYDHSIISSEYKNLNEIYFENAFYEDLSFNVEIFKDRYGKPFNVIYTAYNDMNYELVGGRELENPNEAFIILPKGRLDEYSMEISRFLDGFVLVGEESIKFVGFGSSQYVNFPTLISSRNLSDLVCGITYRNVVNFSIDAGSYSKKISQCVVATDTGNPRLEVSYDLADYIDEFEFKFMLSNLYEITNFNDLEVVYSDEESQIRLLLPVDCQYEFGGVYEVCIYADRPNSTTTKLEELGYSVIRPSIYYSKVDQNYTLFLIYVVVSTLIVFTLGFISNAILLRLYDSKIKQYTVFRSLGVVKKEMKFIVLLEFLVISLFAIITAYISIYLVNLIFEFEFLDVLKYNNLSISLLYMLAMIIFVLFVVNKFNKRLFMYSVQNTFKTEVSK